MRNPVTTVITITTDYPNSDGRARTEAKALYEYFTRKAKYSCQVTVKDEAGNASFSEAQYGQEGT